MGDLIDKIERNTKIAKVTLHNVVDRQGIDGDAHEMDPVAGNTYVVR